MQLRFDQADLRRAADIVAGLLNRSTTTLPVLANLLVEGRPDGCTFTGTDLESLVRVNVPAALEGQPGRITLPADKLAQLVRLLPAEAPVTIEDRGGQIRIACDGTEYQLVTLPAEDYPNWQTERALSTIALTQKNLRALLDGVLYALPAKDHRRVLMGALLEIKDGQARMTATDGKKLSRMAVPLADGGDGNTAKTVVSGKLLGDVRKALSDEGSAEIEIGERQVAFRVGSTEFRTNAIEGKYPDCEAVIPREFNGRVKLNRDLFKMAARRAGVVSSDDKNKSIILRFSGNRCEFQSMAQDVGTFSGGVAVEYDAQSIELAFNYQLLIETLDSFSSPLITMSLKSEQSPCVFTSEDEPLHLCVLMPIKLAEARPAGAAAAGAPAL